MSILGRLIRVLRGRSVVRAAERNSAAADRLDAALRELLRQ